MGFDEEHLEVHGECRHEITALEAQLAEEKEGRANIVRVLNNQRGDLITERDDLLGEVADQIIEARRLKSQLAESEKEIDGLKRRALPSDKYQIMGPPRDATPESQIQWLTENRNLHMQRADEKDEEIEGLKEGIWKLAVRHEATADKLIEAKAELARLRKKFVYTTTDERVREAEREIEDLKRGLADAFPGSKYADEIAAIDAAREKS